MSSLTRPLSVQLEITDKCNFRCRHCYHLDFDCEVSSQDFPDSQVMLMAEKLVEAGIFGVTVTGGEPFVRKELVKRLVKYFAEHNTDVSLNTNLLLLDQATLEDLMANNLGSMLVSCASADSELYGFMTGGGNLVRFEDRLRMAIDHGQGLSINMVVNQNNFGSIRQTATRMHELGVKTFGATPMGLNLQNPDLTHLLRREQVIALVEELMWIKENLGMNVDIFEAMPKCVFPTWVMEKNPHFVRRSCQAGRTIVSVANNGDVRPCSHNPDVYGNILRDSLEVIWAKMEEWRDYRMTPNRCITCKLEAKCHGGCRITAKAHTDDCKGEDPWMDVPVSSIKRLLTIKSDVILEPKMTLVISERFRWRKENKEEYLITSTKNNRNATIVNQQLFEFVCQLRDKSPITLEDIVVTAGCDFDNAGFQRIIKLLVNREFVTLQTGRKEVNTNV